MLPFANHPWLRVVAMAQLAIVPESR